MYRLGRLAGEKRAGPMYGQHLLTCRTRCAMAGPQLDLQLVGFINAGASRGQSRMDEGQLPAA